MATSAALLFPTPASVYTPWQQHRDALRLACVASEARSALRAYRWARHGWPVVDDDGHRHVAPFPYSVADVRDRVRDQRQRRDEAKTRLENWRDETVSNQSVKAITLWQPWATLVAIGAKSYETRSWATRYRGDLAIHASAKRDAEILAGFQALRPELFRHRVIMPPQIFGAVLCIVTLVDCIPTEAVPEEERRFGNFTPGRWAWKLENVRPFDPPIPARGAQGLWDWQIPELER